MTDILREKNVRPIGLDMIREHHVFSTFNEVIQQIKETDIPERSVLLKRIEKELLNTVSTWKILSNQSCSYGMNKTNQDQTEIEKLEIELIELEQKKKLLIKQRDELNKEHDKAMIKSKNDINDIITQNQKEVQKYQQQQATNNEILKEYKSST